VPVDSALLPLGFSRDALERGARARLHLGEAMRDRLQRLLHMAAAIAARAIGDLALDDAQRVRGDGRSAVLALSSSSRLRPAGARAVVDFAVAREPVHRAHVRASARFCIDFLGIRR